MDFSGTVVEIDIDYSVGLVTLVVSSIMLKKRR